MTVEQSIAEQNKALPRRFFKAFETNDQAELKEVLSPDLVAHHPGTDEPVSREKLLHVIALYQAAFSDQQYTIEEQVAEGDRVATRVTWRATHSGDYFGLPPTGKRVAMSGIAISRIKDGQIVERWLDLDALGLMRQLGLIPPPEQD